MSLSGEERELRCVLSWFCNWEDHQKEQFLTVLVEKAVPPDVDQLFRGLDQLNLNGCCQSVIQCQLKLFSQWFDNWSDQHRNRFLFNLQLKDPSFVEKFQAVVNQKT